MFQGIDIYKTNIFFTLLYQIKTYLLTHSEIYYNCNKQNN